MKYFRGPNFTPNQLEHTKLNVHVYHALVAQW